MQSYDLTIRELLTKSLCSLLWCAQGYLHSGLVRSSLTWGRMLA